MQQFKCAVLLFLASITGTASAGVVGLGNPDPGNPLLTLAPPSSEHLGSFSLNIIPNATLSGNAAALAAFNRAADQWAARISDPITVNVDAGLGAFADPNIIGSTSAVFLQGPYTLIRDAMVSDAADEPSNAIVASLPTAPQFTAFVKAGSSISSNIVATKANLKALNFAGLDDPPFGASDGTITFNQAFAFDFDNSDGVTAGQIDFETVAAHEIGHLLGFVSVVDQSDQGATVLSMNPLDLFRFGRTSSNPANASEFTTFPRNFVPGADTITDDISNEYRMSTGVTLGDGRQASHWKDDALTASLIGIMDPTLSTGIIETVGDADFRAMDIIGYEVAVPEPTTLGILAIGGLFLLRRRRRAAA